MGHLKTWRNRMSIRNVDHSPSKSYIEQIEKYTKNLLKQNFDLKSNQGENTKIQSIAHQLDLFYQDLVDIPEDLCRRIKTELEGRIMYQRKHEKRSRFNLFRYFLITSTVFMIGFGGYFFSKRNAVALNTHKDFLSAEAYDSPVQFFGTGKTLQLHFQAEDKEELTIRKGLEGAIIKTFSLDHDEQIYPIKNAQKEAMIISVWRKKEFDPALFALPGGKENSLSKGEGNLIDFSKAMADYYQVPVEIVAKDKKLPITWEFKRKTLEDVLSTKLSQKSISLQVLSSKIISVFQQ